MTSIFNNILSYKRICLCLISIISCLPISYALPIQVTAKVDSGNLLMGKMGMLELQTIVDRGKEIHFPMLETATQDGLVSLVGDTIEIRNTYVADTTQLGGTRIQINYRFPMQAFVPGSYLLPAIEVISGNEKAESNRIALKITGPDVQATDSISPDASPVGPYYTDGWQKVTDKIPNIIYYYWWIFIILAGAILFGIRYLLKHPIKKVPWLKPKPEPTPYELAISRMRSLKQAKLDQNGMEKEYYSKLTEILRQYLWGRFHINALEMTTSQIREAVRKTPDAQVGKKYIEDVLGMADFVKFAKFRPLPDDNVKAFENVLQFIEQTKPVMTQEKSQQEVKPIRPSEA